MTAQHRRRKRPNESQPDFPKSGEVAEGQEIQNGSGSKTRTCDPRINSPLLYQLSYAGTQKALKNSSKAAPRQAMLRGKPGPSGVYSRSV